MLNRVLLSQCTVKRFVRRLERVMTVNTQDYTQELHNEIERTPEEFRPLLLRIVHSFREGVMLPSAEESFLEGWKDIQEGETHSVDGLWDGIDTH